MCSHKIKFLDKPTISDFTIERGVAVIRVTIVKCHISIRIYRMRQLIIVVTGCNHMSMVVVLSELY